VDSFLYYQPVALNDPFLDSLSGQYDTDQVVKVRVIPPPPPPPAKMKQVEGYRVQTFAGTDSINALVMVNNLRNALPDSVYFLKEDALFKIQLGDYLYRNDADMKVLDLRKDGFSGAWVVQRLVNIPIKKDSSTGNESADKEYPFKIQVLVTADLEKAKSVAEQLQMQFNMESSYTENSSLYKVFLGKFITREEAEKVLANVRTNGYKDAWLVYNK
jgi:hypothetical protein